MPGSKPIRDSPCLDGHNIEGLSHHEIKELACRCRNGDQHAYCPLYYEFRRIAFPSAIRLVGSQQDAEDVFQEAFIKYAGLIMLKGSQEIKDDVAYFLKIVSNKSLTLLRRRKRQVDPEKVDIDSTCETRSRTVDPSTSIKLKDAIYSLPPGQKVLIDLYYSKDLSVMEISRLLKKSEGAISTMLFRARKTLRELLDYHNNGKKCYGQKTG